MSKITSQFMKKINVNTPASGQVAIFIAYSGRWIEQKHRQVLKQLLAEIERRGIHFPFNGDRLDAWLRAVTVDAPYRDFTIEGSDDKGWTYSADQCGGGFLSDEKAQVLILTA